MKIKILHFFLFLTALFLAACGAYQPAMVQLTPEDSNHQLALNKEVLELEKDGLSLTSTFLQSTEFDLLFQIEIENETDEEIRVRPEQFQYFALNPDGDIVTDRYAFPPDDIVFELTESIERDRRAAKRASAMGWVFFGLNAIAATVSFASDNPEIGTGQAIDAGINLAAAQVERSAIKKHIVHLETERQFYDNAAIRDTVLAPGDSVEGLVIYPRLDEAYQLLFEFDLGERLFEITYKQEWRERERKRN